MAKIDDSVKKKVPELRFKGFTDDWEERKLGEVGKTKSGIGFPDAQQGGKQVTLSLKKISGIPLIPKIVVLYLPK